MSDEKHDLAALYLSVPRAARHFYEPGVFGSSILLHRGKFCSPSSELDEDAYDGDVRLVWQPTPRIVVRGERQATPDHLKSIFEHSASESAGIWRDRPSIRPLGDGSLPLQASAEAPKWSRNGTSWIEHAIYPPELGNGTELTKVTALLVNGFQAHDAAPLAHIEDQQLQRALRGRTVSRGDGWEVILDDLGVRDTDLWEALTDHGGYTATHVVTLTRTDERRFTAEQATRAMDAIRCALAIALGRQTDFALPVGWRGEEAVWSRWTAGRADPFVVETTWLDASIRSRGIGELIGRVLGHWNDDLKQDTLFYASSYYVQALSAFAEPGIATAISGLLLLASTHLVEELKLYKRSRWDDRRAMNAQKQIRALLDLPHFRISTIVPPAYVFLRKVVDGQNKTRPPHEQERDGLSCIIKMRNDVVHPTRDTRTNWLYQESTEAHELSLHFLELALLAYVGYRGNIHPRTAAERMTGFVEDVPWLGC